MGKTIPVCCGIDVHKTFLVATILMGDYLIPQCKQKHFGTSYRNLIAFRQWLLDNNCKDVCMESTGKYWVPVWNALEGFVHVVIANPKWVSAVKGNKDDKKDSKWIGNLFRMGLVPGSYIPVKDIRILRECTRYRSKLVSMRSSEKNRFQNAFTVCNLTLDAVVSDMFGKSATAIENYLLDTETVDPNYCVSLLHRSMMKKADAVIEAVEGFNMTPEQKERVRIVQGHFADIDKRIGQIDDIVSNLASDYEGTISLLCTIPGVDRRLAITILSEIGTNMSEFGSARRLCSWAGLTPANNQSAGKKKSVKISRAGVYLKPALVEAAHAAVKSTEKQPYFRIKYEHIMKRRGKKRAIIAIARMILTSIYAMLSSGEVFNPSDLQKYDLPEELKKKMTLASAKDAVKLLVSLGVIVEGSISLDSLALAG
ncbi:MAG: IS110 family transposase [Clostridia bacterium]|nr:IS110 family transposase [Clostridia bacterium]MBR4537465.1 IS110 family transposase [Clostridia bacterium]